jgi:cytosine/adenosine deaminase-related metal-dependent hydrolase
MIVAPCAVLTGGPEPMVMEDAGVRIAGAHIAQIGPAGALAASHPGELLWPGRGRVLMPGLVNTHAHLARHLARGLGLRPGAESRRFERSLSPEDVHWAALAAMVEGVRHGVTAVCDFHRSGTMPDFSLHEIVNAAARAGVRIATCFGAAEHDSAAERRDAHRESSGLAADLRRGRNGSARAMVGVSAHSVAGLDRLLGEAHEASGGALAVHVDLALDLTPAERWTPRAPRAGVEHPALWTHAESAPRGLLGALRERGDALSAMGASAVSALVRDLDVAWGSDGGVNAPPLPDPQHGWGRATALAHYRRLFVHGARWGERHFGEGLGQIAAGAPADLVLVDYRPATEFSTRTVLDHLETGLLRAPVSGVMVAGQVVMDDGVIVTVDENDVAARTRECAARLWARLG